MHQRKAISYWKEDKLEFLEVTRVLCEEANYVTDVWNCGLQDGWFPRIDADRKPAPTD